MVSAQRFYRLARQKLPIVVKEACNVFSINEFDTDIVYVNKDERTEKLREGVLDYRSEFRKLEFSPKVFFKYYPLMKRRLSKNVKNFTLEFGVMSYLPHETSHQAHDAKTDYELAKEMTEIQRAAYVFNDKNSKIIACVCNGITEGIAEYAENIILERLGFDELKNANKKLRDEVTKVTIKESEDVTFEDMPDVIAESLQKSSWFTMFVSELLQRKFKREGLESFRKDTEVWRPSQLSYDAAKTMLESSFECLRQAYL